MPRSASAADASGHWVGVLEHGGRTWRAELDLGAEQGQVVGLASYPDGGRFYLPLTGVRVNGARVALIHALDRGTVTWRGTLQGETYTGAWRGLGIDASRIGIGGFSQGGLIASMVLAGEPKGAACEHDAPWDWPRVAPTLEPLLAEWIRTHVTTPPHPQP